MSEDSNTQNAEQSDEQSGQTVLYAMTRDALRAEDLESIRDALDAEGYELLPAGENVKIVRQEDVGPSVDPSEILG